jgi:hypothetical protein
VGGEMQMENNVIPKAKAPRKGGACL